MKNIIPFIVSFNIIESITNTQCIVDAEVDRNLCPEEITKQVDLNGQILSADVIKPAWSANYYNPLLNQYYYAASMLNESTILEPTIKQHFERSVMYYLEGISSDHLFCIDFVRLNFSNWNFLAIDKRTGKAPTDTVELWIAAASNWEHIKYEWFPNHMVSDSTVAKPQIWNNTTIFYNLEFTDELNCTVADDVFDVHVINTDLNERELIDIKIFPNPSSYLVHANGTKKIESINLYSTEGQLLNKSATKSTDVSFLIQGQYVNTIFFADKTFKAKQIYFSGT